MPYLTATFEPGSRRAAGEPLKFVASSESTAADGGVLYASGWELARFHGSGTGTASGYGPWLWGHDYNTPPIGKVRAHVEGRQLVAEVWPDMQDPLGVAVARKYRDGFLRDVSVGFTVKEYAPANQVPAGAKWASTRHELQDLSAVVMGSDPQATILRSLANHRQRIVQSTKDDPHLVRVLEGILAKLKAREAAEVRQLNQFALRDEVELLCCRLLDGE